MNSRGAGFLVFFGIFWSALTLFFDGLVFVPAARQLIALSFPSTEGTILSSELTRGEDSEGGTVHGVAVQYTYAVAGRDYTGSRYRYNTMKSSDCAWAHKVIAAHPPGTKVRVFYHPKDPQDSVLAVGLSGSDLFQFAFMTPFNAVMLTFGWVGLARLRQAWLKPLAGGVRIRTRLKTTRVRLTSWSPAGAALATTTLLAFLSIFIVGFLWGGFHPPMKTMLVTWSIILGGGLAAGLWQGCRLLSGKYDLLLDAMAGSLDLPATQGRKSRRRISLQEVQAVRVDAVLPPTTSDESSYPRYAPTLVLRGTPPGSEPLAQWFDRDKAELFAQWLRTKLPPASTSSLASASNEKPTSRKS